jgi:hypothetical protein
LANLSFHNENHRQRSPSEKPAFAMIVSAVASDTRHRRDTHRTRWSATRRSCSATQSNRSGSWHRLALWCSVMMFKIHGNGNGRIAPARCEDRDRGALFRGWLCLDGRMTFDPASQVFWKDEGLSTALPSYQCAFSDSVIDCGATRAGNCARLRDTVGKWCVHIDLAVCRTSPASLSASARTMAIYVDSELGLRDFFVAGEAAFLSRSQSSLARCIAFASA